MSSHYCIFTATLPYKISKEAGLVVALCRLLKATGQGRSEQAALKELKDAIALKLRLCMEKGILSETLKEYGFPYSVVLGDREIWATPEEEPDSYQLHMRRRIRIHSKPIPRHLPMQESGLTQEFPWWIGSEPASRHSRPS